jgi:uncharacterized membrane protein YfcA
MNDLTHLAGLAPLTFAGAAAMTFGAAFVRGLTGFGMAIILVPLLGLIMPPGEAVVLGILLQLLIGPVGFRRIAADADRRMPQHPDGHRPGRASIGFTGIASGILTGFAAMPGPPVVPFYLRQRIAPGVARASMMLVFFATAIAGTLASLWFGLATMKLFILSLLLFLPMALGDYVGTRLFGRVPVPVWRGIVAVVLGVAGLSALLRLLN